MKKRNRILIGAVIALIVVFLGVKNFQGSQQLGELEALTLQKLGEQVEKWKTQNISDYEFDIKVKGATTGDYHVVVKNNQVVQMTEQGGVATSQDSWPYYSVIGLLETISWDLTVANDPELNSNQQTPTELLGAFDPQYHYPSLYLRQANGVPLTDWQITNFKISARTSETVAPISE